MDNPNAERDALINMMADFDKGIDVDAKYGAKPAEPDAETKPEVKVETPEPPKPEEKKPDAKVETPEPKTEEPAKSSLKEEPKAPESQAKPKSKWAANEERKAKTWEQINAEKEALKAEREKIAREREEWQKKQAVASKGNERLRDEHGFTVEDYRKFADTNLEKDPLMAKAAMQRAAELEKHENEAKAKAQQEDLNKAILTKYEALCQKNPALKDPNSEDWKAVETILREHPLLLRTPDGIEYAVKAVDLERKARDAEVKDSKIKQLTAELESLKKKLAIGSGVPAEPPKEKSFEEMTLAEQRKHLEQSARRADRDAGWAA